MIELIVEGSDFIRADTNQRVLPISVGKPANVVFKSNNPKGDLQSVVKRLETGGCLYTTPGDYISPDGANAFCLGDPIADGIDLQTRSLKYNLPIQYYRI